MSNVTTINRGKHHGEPAAQVGDSYTRPSKCRGCRKTAKHEVRCVEIGDMEVGGRIERVETWVMRSLCGCREGGQ